MFDLRPCSCWSFKPKTYGLVTAHGEDPLKEFDMTPERASLCPIRSLIGGLHQDSEETEDAGASVPQVRLFQGFC